MFTNVLTSIKTSDYLCFRGQELDISVFLCRFYKTSHSHSE